MLYRRWIVLFLAFCAVSLAFADLELPGFGDASTTVSAAVTEWQSCAVHQWQEEIIIAGTCTEERTSRSCSDPPLNTTCTTESQMVEYACQTGTETITHNETVCKPVGYVVNGLVHVPTERYGCTVYEDGHIIITCDSVDDGNGDGICTSGESCVEYTIMGGTAWRKERNSGDVIVDSDPTAFLPAGEPEVLS